MFPGLKIIIMEIGTAALLVYSSECIDSGNRIYLHAAVDNQVLSEKPDDDTNR